jgi:hypothetical protein
MSIPSSNNTHNLNINFVVKKTLNANESKWFAKTKTNSQGDVNIIFFQKKNNISISMKILLLIGKVEKGTELASKHLNELNIANNGKINIEKKDINDRSLEIIFLNIKNANNNTQNINNGINTSSAKLNHPNVKFKFTNTFYNEEKYKFCYDMSRIFTNLNFSNIEKMFDQIYKIGENNHKEINTSNNYLDKSIIQKKIISTLHEFNNKKEGNKEKIELLKPYLKTIKSYLADHRRGFDLESIFPANNLS